ncbi:MAG: hypothetical protein P8L18_16920 [Verrucomicrobiota bacterium]|nr:hypothetical protein [Verrucomicrobiota bacterium]
MKLLIQLKPGRADTWPSGSASRMKVTIKANKGRSSSCIDEEESTYLLSLTLAPLEKILQV